MCTKVDTTGLRELCNVAGFSYVGFIMVYTTLIREQIGLGAWHNDGI